MKFTSIINKFVKLFILSSLVFYSCVLRADPPTRVARLSYLQGNVSFSQAGLDNWVDAILNRPLVNGDSLWVDNNALAQVQLDTAIIGLDAQTQLMVLNVNDQTAQFQLATGRACLTVGALTSQESNNEIDTPNLAFVAGTGHYTVSVDQTNNTTSINVIDGAGTVYGENNSSYQLEAGTTYTFPGTDLSNYTTSTQLSADDFTNWCLQTNKTVASTHISSRVVGYEDLETTGSWTNLPEYGQAWSPPNVPADWSPYTDGHWEWIDPWGWTWVGNASWGFAPYHYGRWVFANGQWFWVPGPADVAPVYAPAMVSFVGVGDQIGWFPLAPNEPFVPWYAASFNYFNIVNNHNSHFHHWNQFHHFWNAKNFNYNFRNRQHGFVAVPNHVFTGAQPVFKNRMKVSPTFFQNKPLMAHPNLAPTPASITGNAPTTHIRPPRRDLTKPIIVHQTPPPITVPNPTNPSATTVVKPPQFNVVKPHRPPTTLPLPGQPTRPITGPKPPVAPIIRPPIQRPITAPVQPVTPANPVMPVRPARPVIRPQVPPTTTTPIINPPHYATPPHIVAPVQHPPTIIHQPRPVIHAPQVPSNPTIVRPVVHPQPTIVRPQPTIVRPQPVVRPQPQPVVHPPVIYNKPQFHTQPTRPVNPSMDQLQQTPPPPPPKRPQY